MSIRKVLLLATVVIFPWTVAAEAQKGDDVKAEMKRLQGVWQVTKWTETDGTLVPPDEINGMSFEFKDDRMIQRKGGRAREPLKFTLNLTKKPKWIDLHSIEVIQGIYKLEADELTLCLISGSNSDQAPERPTEFMANKNKYHTVFVLKKAKK